MKFLQELLILSLLANLTLQRRKPKQKVKVKVNPLDRLPAHISKELLCIGCKAFNDQVLASLRGKKKEYEVFDGMKEVCDTEFKGFGKRAFYFRI